MFVSSRERNSFQATILLKGIDEKTSVYLAKMLTSYADIRTTSKTTISSTQHVFAEILKDSKVTIEELAVACGLTYYGVYYHLRKLKKNKIIIRVGGSKDEYWKC